MRRILAICTSHIGGVLLVTPALELLRHFFPAAEISVLVRRGTEAMLENNPSVKRIYTDGEITSNQRMHQRTKSSLGKRLGQVPGGFKLLRELRRERFDAAVDFSGSDRAALFAFLCGAKERVGYEPGGGFAGKRRLFTQLCPRSSAPKHKVLQFAELAFQFADRHSGASAPHPPVGPLVLNSTAANLSWAEAEWQKLGVNSNPRVLLHPTSRVAYKCWTPEKWAAVIERLQKTFHARLMLTCSPDSREIKMAQVILDLCPVKPEARLGGLALNQLAALQQRAQLFLGVDSAPMHMAAAVGTPVVALFGPSDDVLWSPWGEAHAIIRAPCRCLGLKQSLCPPGKVMECLNVVSADDFFRQAAAVLSRLGPTVGAACAQQPHAASLFSRDEKKAPFSEKKV
jgi:heptosyltransferase-3